MVFKRWKNVGEILPECVECFSNEYNCSITILKEIEEYAKREKVPILLPSAAAFLRFAVSVLKPRRVLEVGTGIGYSTLVIKFACPGSEVITVEANRKRAVVAEGFFKKAGVRISLLKEDGFEVLRDFLARGEKFDFIFVDSIKSEYPFFNFKVQALLSERGVAVFDNVLFRGYVAGVEHSRRYTRTINLLRSFLRDVKEYPGFETLLLPVGDGLLVIYNREHSICGGES